MAMDNIGFRRYSLAILTAAAIGLVYLCYQIFRPFFAPLAWALVLSIVFYPLNALIQRRVKSPAVASAITLAAIILLMAGPFGFIAFKLIQDLYEMSKGSGGFLADLLDSPASAWAMQKAGALMNKSPEELSMMLRDNLSSMAADAMKHTGAGLGNAVKFGVDLILMAFALFFLLKDGKGYLETLRSYLPFDDALIAKFQSEIKDMVITTVYGGVIVAIAQGVLGGASFAILGLPSPVLWGAVMSMASFIPMVGTALVWVPAALYFLIKGSIIKAVIMAVIGVMVIGMADNLLRPIIIGSRVRLPMLVIFLSVFGGIKLFGMIGLILGPLCAALLVTLLDALKEAGGKEGI